MCGICGIAYSDRHRSVDRSSIEAMMSTLVHRGPDDCGIHLDGCVGLGHRRLSIVDVEGGHQPLANEDETVWISANGEIYNHPELREGLTKRGHRYRTRSDNETIVHLYEERGPARLGDLRGMFAFALWDARSRRLLLARDRLGIKPLYYWISPHGDIIWASEIKALLATRYVRPALNHTALPEYLVHRYTTGRATLFRDVHRLLPGHFLTWQAGQVSERRYWSLANLISENSDSELSLPDSQDAFEAEFRDSVRSHLMSDVPIGMFLSGGIDSSAVALSMRDLIGERLSTFSVGYDGGNESELSYARSVARHIGSDHHEVVVSDTQFFEALPKLVWHEDEPIAFPSSVSLYFVAALAGGSVKVVLTGEGGDELFAGYGKYQRTIWNFRLGEKYERLPAPLRRWIGRAVRALPQTRRTFRRLERTFLARPVDPEALFFDNFGVYTASELPHLLSPELWTVAGNGNVDLFAGQRKLWMESAAAPLLTRLLYVDTLSYLHELLMKQDQMSMAASIESRVPFLDNRLIDLAYRLPERAKVKGGKTKWVIRQAMENRLPTEILRRPKMGFPTPVGRWLAGSQRSWIEDFALSPERLSAPLFNHGYVRRIADQHLRGQVDHTERLWAIINLEVWAQHYPQIVTSS
jgi:asparagine synthase (glutamine-hydrolysing)